MSDGKRVLVVDDDDYWRERTTAMVIACGHSPITATGSREAEDLLDSESFDLIITDNSMETYDAGFDLLAREWYLNREIPSILCSSATLTRELEEKLKQFPHVTYVEKSVSRENLELLATIRRLLP